MPTIEDIVSQPPVKDPYRHNGEALPVADNGDDRPGLRRFYIESYGCQMNFSDSEIVASILTGAGFGPTRNMEEADLVLVNTCSIREKAEQTIRNRLTAFRHLKRERPGMLIGVLGCMAERLKSKLLEEEKLVKRQQGKGTFVSANSTEKRWLTLESSWAGMVRAIERNVPQFIPTADPPALPTLEPDEAQLAAEYVFLRSVQKKDGVPYALVSVHVAKDLYDRHRDDFMKRTALSVLAELQDLRIQKAYQTLEVQTTEKDVANLLRISLSAPTVACRCVVINDQGEAIYVANITYRGDCVKLSMNLLPA